MGDDGTRRAARRKERILACPLWDGAAFRNIHPIRAGLRSATVPPPTVREFLFTRGRRMPLSPLPIVDPRPAWARPCASGLRATWLGHSTLLLEIDGYRVLTDPVWGPRASPVRFMGPRRFQPVPVHLSQLPPIDAIVISHDHYDHLDYPTIRALRRVSVPIVTALGVGERLERFGIAPERVTELDWWESHRIPGTGLEITAAPSQHFSGRTLADRNSTLWASMAIRGPRHAVFFSGDTGLTDEYAQIRSRLGPFDLVLLEIGAFHPSWGDIHLGPANALEAHRLLGGGTLLPVHWGTFPLAMHDWDEPVEDILRLAEGEDVALLLPRLGEVVEPALGRPVDPWWRRVEQGSVPAAAAPVDEGAERDLTVLPPFD